MLQQLPLRYWLIVQLSALFTLARFSEAFLVLRAQNIGLAVAYIPAVMIVMNICYAGIAYPGGVVADRIGHRHLLQVGKVGVLSDLRKCAVIHRKPREDVLDEPLFDVLAN